MKNELIKKLLQPTQSIFDNLYHSQRGNKEAIFEIYLLTLYQFLKNPAAIYNPNNDFTLFIINPFHATKFTPELLQEIGTYYKDRHDITLNDLRKSALTIILAHFEKELKNLQQLPHSKIKLFNQLLTYLREEVDLSQFLDSNLSLLELINTRNDKLDSIEGIYAHTGFYNDFNQLMIYQNKRMVCLTSPVAESDMIIRYSEESADPHIIYLPLMTKQTFHAFFMRHLYSPSALYTLSLYINFLYPLKSKIEIALLEEINNASAHSSERNLKRVIDERQIEQLSDLLTRLKEDVICYTKELYPALVFRHSFELKTLTENAYSTILSRMNSIMESKFQPPFTTYYKMRLEYVRLLDKILTTDKADAALPLLKEQLTTLGEPLKELLIQNIELVHESLQYTGLTPQFRKIIKHDAQIARTGKLCTSYVQSCLMSGNPILKEEKNILEKTQIFFTFREKLEEQYHEKERTYTNLIKNQDLSSQDPLQL